MDRLDRLIINSIQEGFPIESRPYDALADRINKAHGLNIDGTELLSRVKALKAGGYIRRLGAVFNARNLGYSSTLCAARVPEDKIDQFGDLVNQSPQVTHNYLRSDDLNIWFTYTSGSPEELPAFLDGLKRATGIDEIYVLESEKLFKIKVGFQLPDKA
ncbi:Lrp/AsnC family transcriptional regulator [Deltaproteobacteria bacterium Smac51]|nr:Lrp/AsnC family transcriptional regulator [Deltaproteobacteria bacterium Smac51]